MLLPDFDSSFLSSTFCTFKSSDGIVQSNKAAGYDNIPMSLIKESIQLISEPLAHIINLSIAHGIVPDQMKRARVIPLFKADDQLLFTNYRPVSLLTSFPSFLRVQFTTV